MALKRLPYDEAALLLRDYLSTQEDEETAALIRALRPARTRGYLTPSELEKVCRWKSARAIRYIKANVHRACVPRREGHWRHGANASASKS